MIYSLINYNQRISKKNPQSPKWHCFASLHIMGNQEYRVWSKIIYLLNFYIYKLIKIFGHTTWNFLIVYIKSYLMTWKDP